MPKSISGRISALILALFAVQFIYFVITAFNYNGFAVIVSLVTVVPFVVLVGIIFGILGVKKEAGIRRLIPVLTLMISAFYGGFSIYLIFFWSFGG
nr:hypothetical protein [Jeotgalibacillus malaysiensis]